VSAEAVKPSFRVTQGELLSAVGPQRVTPHECVHDQSFGYPQLSWAKPKLPSPSPSRPRYGWHQAVARTMKWRPIRVMAPSANGESQVDKSILPNALETRIGRQAGSFNCAEGRYFGTTVKIQNNNGKSRQNNPMTPNKRILVTCTHCGLNAAQGGKRVYLAPCPPGPRP
jgi:hypothetical protein